MLEITDPQGAAGSMIHIPSWAALEGSINAYEVMDGVLIRDLCREPPPHSAMAVAKRCLSPAVRLRTADSQLLLPPSFSEAKSKVLFLFRSIQPTARSSFHSILNR